MEELTKKDPQPGVSNTNNTQNYQQPPQFHTTKPNYSQNYQNYQNPPFSKFQFTAEGKPICFYCHKEGHYQRDCYKKKREQVPAARYPRPNFNPRQNYNPRPNYNSRQNYNPAKTATRVNFTTHVKTLTLTKITNPIKTISLVRIITHFIKLLMTISLLTQLTQTTQPLLQQGSMVERLCQPCKY